LSARDEPEGQGVCAAEELVRRLLAGVAGAVRLARSSSCPDLTGHPRLTSLLVAKAWMAGSSPAMTTWGLLRKCTFSRQGRRREGDLCSSTSPDVSSMLSRSWSA